MNFIGKTHNEQIEDIAASIYARAVFKNYTLSRDSIDTATTDILVNDTKIQVVRAPSSYGSHKRSINNGKKLVPSTCGRLEIQTPTPLFQVCRALKSKLERKAYPNDIVLLVYCEMRSNAFNNIEHHKADIVTFIQRRYKKTARYLKEIWLVWRGDSPPCERAICLFRESCAV